MRNPKYTFVSSVEGKIEMLLIAFPFKSDRLDAQTQIIMSLMKQMEGVTFVVLNYVNDCNKKAWMPVNHWLDLKKCCKKNGKSNHLIRIDIGKGKPTKTLTKWMRDLMLVAVSNDKDVNFMFLAPSHPMIEAQGVHNWVAPAFGNIFNALPNYSSECNHSSLIFDGGNIFITEDYAFIGEDTISLNIQKARDRTTVIEAFRQELGGLEVIVIGDKDSEEAEGSHVNIEEVEGKKFMVNEETIEKEDIEGISVQQYIKGWEGKDQPFYHLDLFITPLGRWDGKYHFLEGEPCVGMERTQLHEKEYELMLREIEVSKCRIATCRKNLVHEFKEEIKFYKIPLPLFRSKTTLGVQWNYASYNNSLVSIKPSKDKQIWIPTYGKISDHPSQKIFQKYDAEVALTLQKAGFKVFSVEGNFLELSKKSGSLRCLTYVLKRDKNNQP